MEIRNQNSSFLLELTAKLFVMNSFLFLHRIILTFCVSIDEKNTVKSSVTLATLIHQLEIRYTAGKTIRWYK